MNTGKKAALLGELLTILLWDTLCADADDHDGRRARQLRLEQISRKLNQS